MADNTEHSASGERKIDQLKNPSLQDVRTHQIGIFPDYSVKISEKGEYTKAKWKIKNLVHPQWFEEDPPAKQGNIFLSPKAEEMLRNWNYVAERWRIRKYWRTKATTGGEKGEWYYRINTPGKSKWIAASERSESQKGKRGMKPGKFAYKLRREIWHMLLNGQEIANLLGNPHLNNYDTQSRRRVSVKIPILKKAVYEIITKEVWPNLGIYRADVAKKWSNYQKVKRHIDDETRNLFAKDLLNENERNHIIEMICEHHWRIIITDWIERRVFLKHGNFDDRPLTELSEIHNFVLQSTKESSNNALLKQKHDLKFDIIDATNNTDEIIIMGCDTTCPGPNYINDTIKGETYCKNCDTVKGRIYSYTDASGMEHYIFDIN
jgi:hypothetical protein